MSKYAERPLAELEAGRQRALAAGDQAAVQEFDGVMRYHPERLAQGYSKASAAGDIDAQEEFRRRYYGQRRPTNDTLPNDPMFLQDAAEYYRADQGKPFEGSPEALGKWAVDRIGQFNYNMAVMGKEALDVATEYDKRGSQALLGLLDAYDHLPMSLEGTGRFLKGVATDPTTYLTGGVGAVAKLAGRGAAKEGAVQAMKAALRKKLKGEVSDALVTAGAKDLVESGITRTGGRTLARSAAGGAAAGAGYGAASDVGRQSVEVGAGAREGVSGGQALGAAAVGAAFGGGLGTAIGSGAGRRARQGIRRTAEGVRVGADADGAAATVAIQKAAIDQAGDETARRQAEEIVQRLHSGSSQNPSEDLRALSQLTLDTTKKAGVDSNARFNADAANTAFVGSAVRAGDMFQRLRKLHDLGVVNTRTMNDIDHALRAGKSPKGFGRPQAFERALSGPGMTPEVRDILRGLKGEVDIMDRLVRVRNLKDQKSLPLQVLDDPRARALFDVYNPFGGSTGARVGLQFAEPLLARLGVAPTPVARSAAARARMPEVGPNLQAALSKLDERAAAGMAGTSRAYERFARLQDQRNFQRLLQQRRAVEQRRQRMIEDQRSKMDREDRAKLLEDMDAALGPVEARGGLQQQWRDATGLDNQEILRGLESIKAQLSADGRDTRQLSKVLEDFQANRPIRDEQLFYRIQDRLIRMQEQGLLKQADERLRPALVAPDVVQGPRSSVRNPIAYQAAVSRAEESARDVTVDILSLPLPPLQKADLVETINRIRTTKDVAEKQAIFKALAKRYWNIEEVRNALRGMGPALVTGSK